MTTIAPIIENSKFATGPVSMTRGIASERSPMDVANCFIRHCEGDWGDVSEDDAAENEQALVDGTRLFSVYETDLGTIWIITEADRSSTTILLPEDY